MKKKLLVLLVTAALALVALPMAAFADDSVAAIDDKKYPTPRPPSPCWAMPPATA